MKAEYDSAATPALLCPPRKPEVRYLRSAGNAGRQGDEIWMPSAAADLDPELRRGVTTLNGRPRLTAAGTCCSDPLPAPRRSSNARVMASAFGRLTSANRDVICWAVTSSPGAQVDVAECGA